MIQSMTGFGKSNLKSKKVNLSVQIKSVNGRFLDLRLKYPSEFSEFDQEIRKQLNGHFSRGSVDVFIHRSLSEENLTEKISPNLKLIKAWTESCRRVKKQLKLKSDEYENLYRRIPDFLETSEKELETEEKTLLFECLDEAIKNCISERKKEGESLKKELSNQITQLAQIRSQILNLKEKAIACIRENIEKRISQINTMKVEVDPNRLSQEVLFLADRSDITEELVRLDTHIQTFKQNYEKSGESVGKKLDFITQELLREINTIGSKVQMADVVGLVIEAKTCIERIREQVQNIQ